MTPNLKPYPAYKDSGVEWLGEVPEHWGTSKIKSLARPGHKTFVDGDWIESPYITSEGIRLIQTGNIGVGQYREKGCRYISEETFKNFDCTEFEPGDVLICRLGAPVARACLAPQLGSRMITSVDVCILKLRDDTSAQFLVYSMSSYRYLDWVGSLVRGSTRDRVSRSMLGAFSVPSPPLPEQTAIVRYLNYTDRRIQRYIQAKQKLITLLEEQRQAIIHQVVTGQIDVRTGQPYPAYQDSGVEWLGEVPEHWGVAALRHRYFQCLGKMLDSKRVVGNHLLPYLRNTDVQWDRINIKDLPKMDIFPEEYSRYTVQRGDLLVCEGGEVGRCALWSGELAICGFQKALHRLRPRDRDRDVARFMYYVLRAAAERNAFTDGHISTIAHLTGDKFRAHRFPFPTFSEQTAIVHFLDHTTTDIDHTISCTQRQIDLLSEYRTRLISDVVTGKLDIREAAAALPEVDPLEAEADSADTLEPATELAEELETIAEGA